MGKARSRALRPELQRARSRVHRPDMQEPGTVSCTIRATSLYNTAIIEVFPRPHTMLTRRLFY